MKSLKSNSLNNTPAYTNQFPMQVFFLQIYGRPHPLPQPDPDDPDNEPDPDQPEPLIII